MYCCTGLRNLVSCAGERGLAILVGERVSGHLGFFFQSRGLAFEDETKWKPVNIDVTVNVACEVGLRFCPFCGSGLDDLIQKSPDFFSGLAKDHKKFRSSLPWQ
jgi:hypothetical protein